MALFFAVVDLREQASHQLDEHHHRIVGELLVELDHLRHDCRAPTAALKSPASQAGVASPSRII